jgi:hypothetical protein
LLALRCIQREDKQCHGSYAQVNESDTGSDQPTKSNIRDRIVGMILLGVTEREEDDPSWDSNHTPSAIQGDFISQ